MYIETGDIIKLDIGSGIDCIFLGLIDSQVERALIYKKTSISNDSKLDEVCLIDIYIGDFYVASVKHKQQAEKVRGWYVKNQLLNTNLPKIIRDTLYDYELLEIKPKVGYLYYAKNGYGYINLGYNWSLMLCKETLKQFDGTVEYLENKLGVVYIDSIGEKVEYIKILYIKFDKNMGITKKIYDDFKLDLNDTPKIKGALIKKKIQVRNMKNLLRHM